MGTSSRPAVVCKERFDRGVPHCQRRQVVFPNQPPSPPLARFHRPLFAVLAPVAEGSGGPGRRWGKVVVKQACADSLGWCGQQTVRTGPQQRHHVSGALFERKGGAGAGRDAWSSCCQSGGRVSEEAATHHKQLMRQVDYPGRTLRPGRARARAREMASLALPGPAQQRDELRACARRLPAARLARRT